jgi:SAM-dependent methyltransferase
LSDHNKNKLEEKVIKDFGNEWNEFNQSGLKTEELESNFLQYFNIFPLNELDLSKTGFDLGCGSGRWAKLIAPKVKTLNCIDPSQKALEVAKLNLQNFNNINFIAKQISEIEINSNTQDFGYCLGVLHHTNQLNLGLKFCNRVLKKNSPFLIYLYYDLENRPLYYKLFWKFSNFLRKIISLLPFKFKKIITDVIAILVYFPCARISLLFNLMGFNVFNIPLSDYKNKSLYTMRTDALDRFGTKLERRFSKKEIKELLLNNGFKEVVFSSNMPYWVAFCRKV